MSFEEEVFPLFVIGVCAVTILELVVGYILLKERKKALSYLIGHAGSMAVAMVFLIRCIFARRLASMPNIAASIDNSVNIAMFGIFWAVSVIFALGLAWYASEK